ncbi:MAG: hypothetical protein ABR544_03360 [Gammaproteobacteria bacterium]
MSPGRGEGKVLRLPEEHDLHLSALYHQTEAPQPPPALEQRILHAAREAAEEAVRQRQTRRGRQVPLPLAALLLVASLLLPLLLWYGYQGGFTYPWSVPAAGPPVEESVAPIPAPDVPEPVEPREDNAAGLSPQEQELVAIQALIESGADAEAWERFSDFRMSFPQQRIPDALLDELAGVRRRLLEDAGGR